MKKVPFNQGGHDLKRKMLSELQPADFDEQMRLLQYETRSWCINNFILDKDQITYLNQLPDLLISEIGLNSRIAIQFDQPLILETPTTYFSPLNRDRPRKCKSSVKGGGAYSHGTGKLDYKLEFGVTFYL